MATNYWTHGVGGNDWNVAGNWSLGAVPVGGDDVVFTAVHSVANCTVNLNPAIVLNSVYIAPDFTGNVGLTAAGEKLRPTGITTLVHQGTGSIFVNSPITVAEIRCASNRGTAELANIITDLVCLRGEVTIVTLANIPRVFVEYVDSRVGDVTLTIPTGAFLNQVIVLGGQTTNASAVGNYFMFDGELTHTAGDVTELMQAGGTFAYSADGALYILARADIYAGKFDGTDSALTHRATAMTVWPAATVDLRNGMNNWTVTNGITNHNGTIRVDPLSRIDIS